MNLGRISIYAILVAMLLMVNNIGFASGILVKEGSQGEEVKQVQTLLQEQGYYHSDITGVCDTVTVEAIKEFQQAQGLLVDGVCGSQTYFRLKPPVVTHDFSKARPMIVNALAYSPQDPGMGTHTALGTLLRRGVIAVDPAVIPLGTIVYIPEYGEAIAEDIGGGIQGHTIDIAFDTHEEAIFWGRQTKEIFILE